MKRLTLLFSALALLSGGCSRSSAPRCEQIAPGVWSLKSGTPEAVDLLSELHFTPRREAMERLPRAELPFDPSEIDFQSVDGKTYIRFPLAPGEKIFGLGLNFQTVEQRGRILRLHTDHYNGTDNGRTHAPVPFFVSSRGYGALINSARYIDLWVGTALRRDSPETPAEQDRNSDPDWQAQPYSDNIAVLVPAQGIEVLLFAGPDMLDAVRRYNLYQGGGALPPRWGLGFWHRVPMLYDDSLASAEAARFAEHGFPLSVLGLEPGWQSNSYPCTLEWDSTRFPRPRALADSLLARHIRLNLWMNPYLSKRSELYDKMRPYSADYTVWNGIVGDYTLPEARRLLGEHLDKHALAVGVSGLKMDENDGYDSWLWPDVARFPSGTPAEKMRQIYGTLLQEITASLYRDRNQRTYGLVRASNAGGASYPFVLYNDYYDHRHFITALINSSFIGVLWTPEVRSSATGEEWVRRMQSACFSPLAQLNAWGDGTKPWSFPEVTPQVRDAALLRMRLIPYLYTAFADYRFEGTPPVRAMNLEAGYTDPSGQRRGDLDATENPYAMAVRQECTDQYMVGESLLVAPMFADQTSRRVVLPQGRWYDFYTGELAGEGEIITASPGLDRIPVYVKDGGIVPLWPPLTAVDDQAHPLEIRYYGSRPGSYSLYDDDGTTYDYEKGEFVRISIQVSPGPDGRPAGRLVMPDEPRSWSFSDFTFRYMTPQQP